MYADVYIDRAYSCTIVLLIEYRLAKSEQELCLDDLTAAELARFQTAASGGELGHLVQPWEPWWVSPQVSAHTPQLIWSIHSSSTNTLYAGREGDEF